MEVLHCSLQLVLS